MLDVDTPIYVSGHNGMVGSGLCHLLQQKGYSNVLTIDRKSLDLTNQTAVFDYFASHRPQVQVICAATVGGIVANDTYPADFIGRNLMIETNLIEAARLFNCQKTVFLSSACIYPKVCPQPMREDYLLSGPLEPTNQWYAVAKLAGMKMAQAYRRQYGLDMVSVLPVNLYGPGDNFHLQYSHVVPALLRKAHEAKVNGADNVTVWGTGNALREFMYVDDIAVAIFHLLCHQTDYDFINIGAGKDIKIADLMTLIQEVVGFEGGVRFDARFPDGTPRKLLDSSRMTELGWQPQVTLKEGLQKTYTWFLDNVDHLREGLVRNE